nr:hypothetical protein [Tanacetum cinerariifolium]
MANTTSIVTTVTKTANKEKTPREADAALKRKEVHARLDFRETSKKSQRVGEGSQNSSAGTLPVRYGNPSERPKRRDRLRHNDENVFDRLGHQRQSAFDRLSDTYSPSTTKSDLDRANSRNRSHSRGCSRRHDSSPSRSCPRSRDRLRGTKESYENVPESAPRFDDDFPSIPEGVSGGNSHVTPSAPSISDLPDDGIEAQMIQAATEASKRGAELGLPDDDVPQNRQITVRGS